MALSPPAPNSRDSSPSERKTGACGKCGLSFDSATSVGGQCPRCLLLGFEESDEPPPVEHVRSTAAARARAWESDEELDELAEELPGFEFEHCLGQGGMGVVWRARERVLDRRVAIKLLRNKDKDPAFVERFTREARVMARLHHPHIVTLFAFGRTRSNHCYLVMELVDGEDLARLMARGQMEVPQALSIISAVSEALQAAHREGFVHRDIKPGNVLLDSHMQVKVGDFGLARLAVPREASTVSITEHGVVVGTPHYMAPEQERGRGGEDHRADVYSLGVMLYEMLTGELPRGLFELPSKKRRLDRQLDAIIVRCLQEDPEKRYASVADFAADLQKVRQSVDPVLIAERTRRNHEQRWRRRSELALAILVSSLVGIICAWYAREFLDSGKTPHLAPSRLMAKAFEPSLPRAGITVHDGKHLSALKTVKVMREIKFQPPDLPANAYFGRQLALWRNYLLVSADRDNDGGALYCYRREGADWKLTQRLVDPVGGNRMFAYVFGISDGLLCISSDGAERSEGTIFVFLYDDTTGRWQSRRELDLPVRYNRGHVDGISVSGNLLLIHGGETSRAPETCVLDRTHMKWDRSDPGLPPGMVKWKSALMSPYILIAGSRPREDGRGEAFALAVLNTKDKYRGLLTQGPNAQHVLNGCRALVGNDRIAVVGSPESRDRRGLCWLMRKREGFGWADPSYLLPEPEEGICRFGRSVALRKNLLVIGADHYETSGTTTGMIRLYRMDDTKGPWPSDRLTCDLDFQASDFGNAVALEDGLIAVGAPRSVDAEGTATGAAFVYEIEEAR